MREYPKHLVCHSDSFYIGQKDYKLLVGFKSRQWKLKLKTIRESDRIDSERLIGAVKKKTSFNRMGISVTYRSNGTRRARGDARRGCERGGSHGGTEDRRKVRKAHGWVQTGWGRRSRRNAAQTMM
ncbi:hypothetical protein QJS04_geneDACA016622 [Acorus gramineus]|uniref:Uncharacterized protein n=1 Tax=Acorus gramineus TaxID=55184 RepID=A0AAV9BNH5_ACOGR|nr:hypothetical protein QJS04_geneDACA016622 [Acorus gramineus]